MTPDDGQYTVMLILWTILLGIVLFGLLPAVVLRARRLVAAARSIDANLAATLKVAARVVGNTTPTSALLGQTLDAGGEVLGVAGQIDGHAAAVEGVLAGRAAALRS